MLKHHAPRYYQICVHPCRALFDSQPVPVQSHSCDLKVGIPNVTHVYRLYLNMFVLFTVFCNSFLGGLSFDNQEASCYRWDWSLLSSVPPSKYLNHAFKEATTTHLPQLIICSDLPFHTELPATCVATATCLCLFPGMTLLLVTAHRLKTTVCYSWI
jgi:hypothetical protein